MDFDGTRIRSPGVESSSALSHLPLAIDDQSVVLCGVLPSIAVVAQQPVAATKDHEMIRIGVNVSEAQIGGEPIGGEMTGWRAAFEHDKGLVAAPAGARRNNSHIVKVAQRGQLGR